MDSEPNKRWVCNTIVGFDKDSPVSGLRGDRYATAGPRLNWVGPSSMGSTFRRNPRLLRGTTAVVLGKELRAAGRWATRPAFGWNTIVGFDKDSPVPGLRGDRYATS